MAIDIKSPIAKMPFGQHKGKVFWTLGEAYFNYLAHQVITPDTRDTIAAARLLLENRGSYAVLRRHQNPKWKVSLRMISQHPLVADAHCEGRTDFVYHITEQV